MISEDIPKTSFEEFSRAINKDDLWWDTAISHDVWVIQLTSALLISGAVSNPLLFYLKPLCLLRVSTFSVITGRMCTGVVDVFAF